MCYRFRTNSSEELTPFADSRNRVCTFRSCCIEVAIKENRYSPRVPWIVQIRAGLLHPMRSPGEEATVWLDGSTSDVGKGGLGILSNRLFPPSSVLRCEVSLDGEEIGIPTLAQVRWCEGIEGKRKYRIGLQFLV